METRRLRNSESFVAGVSAMLLATAVLGVAHLVQGSVPFPSLGQWHRQRLPDGCRDAIGIVRIDQQRGFALMRRACEPRQDQHARVIRILRGDIFLGNEIHTVTQWGHQPNTCGTIKPGKSRMAVGMVDVTDRRPVRLTKGAINASGSRANVPLNIGIFRNLGPALCRDL